MSDPLPTDLSALDDPARLNTFDGSLLGRTPDAELEQLVAQPRR